MKNLYSVLRQMEQALRGHGLAAVVTATRTQVERELIRRKIGFRKDDNAFLAVDDPKALQAAADRLSADIIRKRLDYWTWLMGPKFSSKDRAGLF